MEAGGRPASGGPGIWRPISRRAAGWTCRVAKPGCREDPDEHQSRRKPRAPGPASPRAADTAAAVMVAADRRGGCRHRLPLSHVQHLYGVADTPARAGAALEPADFLWFGLNGRRRVAGLLAARGRFRRLGTLQPAAPRRVAGRSQTRCRQTTWWSFPHGIGAIDDRPWERHRRHADARAAAWTPDASAGADARARAWRRRT